MTATITIAGRDISHVVGMDLATKCGYAVLDLAGDICASGVWNLTTRPDESHGFRYVRFRSKLMELLSAYPDCVVGHEDAPFVQVLNGRPLTRPLEIRSAMFGVLCTTCHDTQPRTEYGGVKVSEAKRCATGKANAKKAAMVAAARAKWDIDPQDDNEADAIWIAEVMRRRLVR